MPSPRDLRSGGSASWRSTSRLPRSSRGRLMYDMGCHVGHRARPRSRRFLWLVLLIRPDLLKIVDIHDFRRRSPHIIGPCLSFTFVTGRPRSLWISRTFGFARGGAFRSAPLSYRYRRVYDHRTSIITCMRFIIFIFRNYYAKYRNSK